MGICIQLINITKTSVAVRIMPHVWALLLLTNSYQTREQLLLSLSSKLLIISYSSSSGYSMMLLLTLPSSSLATASYFGVLSNEVDWLWNFLSPLLKTGVFQDQVFARSLNQLCLSSPNLFLNMFCILRASVLSKSIFLEIPKCTFFCFSGISLVSKSSSLRHQFSTLAETSVSILAGLPSSSPLLLQSELRELSQIWKQSSNLFLILSMSQIFSRIHFSTSYDICPYYIQARKTSDISKQHPFGY